MEYQANLTQQDTERMDFERTQEIDKATKEASGETFVPEEKSWADID